MAIHKGLNFKPNSWYSLVLFVIAFWLSSSLLVDFLLMPALYASGMMSAPDFATTGYGFFWLFNRLEILCGALVLTGLLVLRRSRPAAGVMVSGLRSRWAVEMAILMLAIALIYTYGITPSMSALGLPLDGFATEAVVPHGMNQLHGLYGILEMIKLVAGGFLLRLCYSDLRSDNTPVLSQEIV